MLEGDPLARYVQDVAQRAAQAEGAPAWDTIHELAYRVIRLEIALQSLAPGAMELADQEATRRLLARYGFQRLDDLKGPDDEHTRG